jgi:hypothetical protein
MAIILAKWALAKSVVRCLFHARSEFCNYAVGPWVSVAGRETALARGNPAIRKEFSYLIDREICLSKSLTR